MRVGRGRSFVGITTRRRSIRLPSSLSQWTSRKLIPCHRRAHALAERRAAFGCATTGAGEGSRTNRRLVPWRCLLYADARLVRVSAHLSSPFVRQRLRAALPRVRDVSFVRKLLKEAPPWRRNCS